MGDPVDGIKAPLPAWPLRPVAPANRERETGRRKKPAEPRDERDHGEDGDRSNQPTIDEYV